MSTNSEAQKVTEKDVFPNPEGYNLTVYSTAMYWGVIAGGMTVSFFLCCFFLYNVWMVPALAMSYLLFWTIAHKVAEATVNIRFTESSFVIRRLSGSKQVLEFREVVWANVKRYSSSYKYISLEESGGSFLLLSFPVFALFEKRKSRREIFNSFQNVFFKLVWKYKIPTV